MLRLGDLLEETGLGLTLRTGQPEVAERSLQGAAVVEVPDPSRWIAPGWLLLTAGVRLEGCADDELRTLVTECEDAGIAAIALIQVCAIGGTGGGSNSGTGRTCRTSTARDIVSHGRCSGAKRSATASRSSSSDVKPSGPGTSGIRSCWKPTASALSVVNDTVASTISRPR